MDSEQNFSLILQLMKPISTFLIIYYVLGSFLLPMGDFSRLVDLPGMYRHCRDTEDKDMTLCDFITDHLIDVDGIFDKHDHGDKQKPHAPVNFHHQQVQPSFFKPYISDMNNIAVIVLRDHNQFKENKISVPFYNKIFRPPIRNC